MSRKVEVLGVRTVHERNEPSRIEMDLILHYLKGEPVESVVLSQKAALKLIEEIARSIRVDAGWG